LDAGVSVGRKAGMLNTNFIGPNGKRFRAKETLVIGRYTAGLICQSVAQGN
jgi:hypothetical protein